MRANARLRAGPILVRFRSGPGADEVQEALAEALLARSQLGIGGIRDSEIDAPGA